MQQTIAKSTKRIVLTGHTSDVFDESEGIVETKITVKGSLSKVGLESFFSCVVATKKLPLKKLEGYENDLLVITEEDKLLGFKHVFQTRVTKDTVNERIRGPIGLFTIAETYIDNDVQKLMDRLSEYYAED